MTSETEQLVLETAAKVFADAASDPNGLASRIDETGFAQMWCAEAEGGIDACAALGLAVVKSAARQGVSSELTEDMIARWLLSATGLHLQGRGVLAEGSGGEPSPGDFVAGVPFARERDFVLMLANGELVAIPVSRCELAQVENLAGEPRDTLQLCASDEWQRKPLPEFTSAETVIALAALARSNQLVGAMEAVLTLTTEYVSQRVQFGRPLAKFQLVQQMVSGIAGEYAIANAAAEAAGRSLSLDTPLTIKAKMNVAAAKSVASEAAGRVARMSHQCHGAMGFSEEYALQAFTRRLWSWRDEWGTEYEWSERLGRLVAEQSNGSAWAMLSA